MFARVASAATSLQGLIENINDQVLRPAFSLLVSLAAVVFVWGVVQFIARASNEKAREDGKRHIIWGLIGLAVIVGVWGIVGLITDTICGAGGCPASFPK